LFSSPKEFDKEVSTPSYSISACRRSGGNPTNHCHRRNK
jgi:hypothetical protein